jgi:hypothetical protein
MIMIYVLMRNSENGCLNRYKWTTPLYIVYNKLNLGVSWCHTIYIHKLYGVRREWQ